MLLTIGIPTYNRLDALQKNLVMLCEMIQKGQLYDSVQLLISDNASEQDVEAAIKRIQKKYPEINLRFHRQEKNEGPRKNFITILELCDSEYLMLMGDDDFMGIDYLQAVINKIKDVGVACVLPAYYNIDEDGKKNGRGRDLGKQSKLYPAGFMNCLNNSWRGHQMSGLVVKMAGLYDQCVKKEINNWYLQIYLVAYCCMHGKTYHMCDDPIQVTRPPQRKKTWGYGEDGLISSIFNNYLLLDEISLFQRFLLEAKILYEQYWRIAMYLKRGIGAFLKCIFAIAKDKSTSVLMKFLIWILVPAIFFIQGIKLLVTGKLFQTLKTKVDI